MKTTLALFTVLLLTSSPCLAYEPGTHALMSDAAAKQSVLGDRAQDWGFTDGYLDPTTFPDAQWSAADDWGDGDPVPLTRGGPYFLVDDKDATIQTLIRTGAVLEDEGDRAICHFYDPVPGNTHPLATAIGNGSFSAREWATGLSDENGQLILGQCAFPLSNPEIQLYSLSKAEQYFYMAFTAGNEAVRKLAFGQLFLSMGHVTHLMEDMAQPQHVRDDSHCDSTIKCWWPGGYNPSAYEEFVYTYGADMGSPYTPVFGKSREFWSGDSDTGTVGDGLAEFTNSNFVSIGSLDGYEGKLFSKYYLTPRANGPDTDVDIISYNEFLQIEGVPADDFEAECIVHHHCVMTFSGNTIVDNELPNTLIRNNYTAVESLWEHDYLFRSSRTLHTLNNVTYRSAADLLVPRAVGYSTGVINHFFHGQLAAKWADLDPGNPAGNPGTSKLKLTNMTNAALTGGDLGIYYDAVDGQRYRLNTTPNPVNLDAYCPTVLNGAPNPACMGVHDEMDVTITLPLPHAPARPNEYTFVYKGAIDGDDDEYGGSHDEHIAVRSFRPEPDYDVYVRDYIGPEGEPSSDGNIRFDARNKELELGWLPAFSTIKGGCTGTTDSSYDFTTYLCSQMNDLKLYTHDLDGDREYMTRLNWGVHVLVNNESQDENGRNESVRQASEFDFARYNRDNKDQAFTHPEYQDCFNGVLRLAVNQTKVFVVVGRLNYSIAPHVPNNTPCPYLNNTANATLDIFDHSGHLQQMTKMDLDPGEHLIRDLAAGNTGLCFVIFNAAEVTGTAYLTGLDGTSPVSIDNSTAISCSATSDRYYVLDGNPANDGGVSGNLGIATLNSYDANGNSKGTTVLQRILDDGQRPYALAASSNTIYVMTAGFPMRVYRYERKIVNDVAGQPVDTFTFTPDPGPSEKNPKAVANPLILAGSQGSGHNIAVDAYMALHLAGAQDPPPQ